MSYINFEGKTLLDNEDLEVGHYYLASLDMRANKPEYIIFKVAGDNSYTKDGKKTYSYFLKVLSVSDKLEEHLDEKQYESSLVDGAYCIELEIDEVAMYLL